MLKQPQPGALRRRTGILVLGVVLVGSSYAAWAVRPVAPPTPPAPAVPAAPAAPAAPTAPPAPPTLPPPPPAPGLGVALAATSGPGAAGISTPPPEYPAGAAAAHVDGRVVLKLLVGADGTVKDVVVEKAEPAGVFDAATVEAARSWKFMPAMKEGKAVEGWVRVPVDFKAPKAAAPPAPGGGASA